MSKVKDITRDELNNDVLALKARKVAIEHQIAINWREENPELIAELTSIETRLRAAEVVEMGVSEREAISYEREYLKTFTAKAQEAAEVRNQAETMQARVTALRNELKALEKEAQATSQHAAKLAAKAAGDLKRQLEAGKISDLTPFFEVHDQTKLGGGMQHWKR